MMDERLSQEKEKKGNDIRVKPIKLPTIRYRVIHHVAHAQTGETPEPCSKPAASKSLHARIEIG